MSTAPSAPTKVAIVGGGCGALSAAFELTKPHHQGAYEVTVYQMGWRLGGKGASGRNKLLANRTEEHGLHVWMGFYENAFRLVRSCYAELSAGYQSPGTRQSRFGTWEEAFFPDHWVGVADESRGAWRIWSTFFPATPGLPGDELDPDTNPFTLRNYLMRSCDLLRALIQSGFAGGRAGSLDPSADVNDFSSVSPRAIVDKITSVLHDGLLTGAGALYEAMAVLQVVVSGRFSLPNGDYLVLKFAEAISANLKEQAEYLFATDEQLLPKLELVELVVTVIVGILRDQLLSDPDGLDAVNDEDCRVWLRRHGASERSTQSSFVRALYNMAFADQRVDENDQPGLAAGQALRGALRMFFTYRGSLFWKMRAGMGDVVFSPLYEVLKRRGVKFKFFHELTDVITEEIDGASYVTALHFHQQATLALGQADSDDGAKNSLRKAALDAKEYYPLDADGCWPSVPDFAQLGEHNTERDYELPLVADDERRHPSAVVTAHLGKEFDCVVLGVAVGALPLACPSLVTKDRRFKAMVKHVKTVPTVALQLWLKEGLDKLTPFAHPITVSGFLGPFDTWSDMTHIIAEEQWGSQPPQGLVYFCGALGPAQGRLGPINCATDYLNDALPLLWPVLRDKGTRGFDWSLLASPPESTTNDLRSQYLKFNTHPSDRYVLTRPGSTLYRISPLDCPYENLTIAGDWTDCSFNEGCVEAAVMSGLLAAHALSLSPELEDIIGFDHP